VGVRGALVAITVSLSVHLGVAVALLAPHAELANGPPPSFAGDTFELPAPDTAVVPMANASPAADTVATAPTQADTVATAP
jgi:hypothetical protein